MKIIMKNILNFIDTWGVRTMTILVLVVFLKTCSTNSRIEKVDKEIKSVNQSVDYLLTTLKKEIKIEGLKSEKRMIQATDRKMMDVNRQTEIDKEISELEK
jgi:thiamine biosynthesis lipoprotein ApbE